LRQKVASDLEGRINDAQIGEMRLPGDYRLHSVNNPAWLPSRSGAGKPDCRRRADQADGHPDQSLARLREIEPAQQPLAVVLSCSDSRASPEVVFDQGLGDLFVIRVAGNVTDDTVVGSVEYAVEHLKTPLVVVLGHQGCGAVQAAVSANQEANHTPSFVDAIKPLVEETKSQPGDTVENCVRLNVAHVVQQLQASQPVLAEVSQKSKLQIVGAYYTALSV